MVKTPDIQYTRYIMSTSGLELLLPKKWRLTIKVLIKNTVQRHATRRLEYKHVMFSQQEQGGEGA